MEPFVTRIGDVTIERVVPKSGPGSGGGTFGKEAKDPLPPPSVSLAKRDLDGGETISVSEDLQIFLKPPLSGTDKASTGGLKLDGRKSRDCSISGSRETSHGRGDDRMAASGTDDSDASESGDNEDQHSGNMDEEDEMLLPQALDKADTSDLQQRNKSDEQSDVMSNSKVTASSTVDAHSQSAALQNSIETGAVSLEPVRTEQDRPRGDSVMGGSSASDGKNIVEEGTGKMEEDSERGTSGPDTNKRKAQVDAGVMHKKKKTSLSGKDGKDKGDSSSSDSEDGKEDNKSSVMERKLTNMRRNIREVMSENQLDEETLAAQRQEMERLRRVQEQQRIIREVQRQIALNRQNNKTQTRVISLLQGNSSLLKQIPSTSSSGSSGSTQVRLPNTVLVKLASGSGQGSGSGAQTNKKVFELLRVQKGNTGTVPRPGGRSSAISRTVLAKPRGIGPQVHMMTPSVSIAPVISSPRVPPPSESESEGEEDSEREMLARAAALRKVAGKGKGKDVVTISSSSDDDDCILLSEPSSGDEGEPIDDPTNSGMHTNDLYNTPDEQGRVLVNVGHPAEEPEIFLAPQIARIIKPHQIGGVRFLFDNVVESLSRFNTSTGFGCILAHSMGLGKTLQVISFCDVFLRHTSARTVLCIMPINTLQNWLAEFNMWLPAATEGNNVANSSSNTVGSNNSSSSNDNTAVTQQQSVPNDPASDGPADANSTPEIRPRNFALFVLNDSHKSMAGRSKVIQEWSKGGGVLLIGYELYRQLSLKRLYKANSKKRKRKHPDEVVDVDEDDKNKALLEEMHSALVKPGPDLVICDEGHRIKNSHASISQALKQIRSKRRIVLTGYPLQNNLLEYWCMVDFVRPNYLGTKTEFCNMFERPIQNGQCIDSTPQDIRLMRYRAHVLHSLLEGFVQRRSHSVLQVSLPQKEEYVLLLRMTKFQRKLYDTFMNEVVRTKAVPNPLKAFAVCCKIWNHTDVLYYFLKKRMYGEDVDLDLEEATAAANTPLVPGVAANPRGGPGKRGRGARGPRNLVGQSKRERKSSTPFRQLGNNKPAATITPQTVGTSTSNSSTNTNNSSQCNAVPSMGCMTTGTPVQQDPQGSNQPFNIMGQQNSSFSNTGSYPDVQHYNPNSAPPYGYPTNPSASSYDPNYPNNGYSSSHPPYGTSNHNTSAPQYGGSGNYYPSTGGPASGQQGNYENNSMESYYPPGPGNNQGNGYQNPVAGNSTPYWQQPASHGFYQHPMSSAGANGNGSQYYGGNGAGSYGGTHNGETGGSLYYMGHHPHTHQQGPYGDYGNREQGNMYHEMNASGCMGNMGQNTVGSANNSGLAGMAESSQSQSNNMMNMQHNSNMNSNMQNTGTMGNLQSSQNLSLNSMQNPVGSQQNSIDSQNQNIVGNTQNAVNSMQTNAESNLVNKNQNPAGTQQNPIGTAQSPIGNQQNAAGQQQNSVDSHIPMGAQQNSIAGTQTLIGNQQNPVGTPQNSMVNPHNPVRLQQNAMGNTHNPMGTSQNPVGTSQPLIGTQQASVGNPQSMVGNQQSSVRNSQNLVGTQQQNSVGTPQNVMANSQNPMGNNQHFMGTNTLLPPQNPVVTPQNPMGVSQNPIGPSQNPMEMSQNPVQTTQNIMGTSQNPMGPSQNTMGMSQSAMGNPQSSMGTLQNPVTPQQNVMGMSQNPMGTQQNSMAPPQNLMGITQNPVGTGHNPTGTPQSPLSTQQNMLGASNNSMATSNTMGGVQDCIGNSQNLMANSQNSLNSFQSTVGSNSQNAMNIMQNVHNYMHPHPEMGGNTSNTVRNSVQDTYGRMDPNNSGQNTSYNVGNNVNSYHHQQAVQNASSRPCLQQGSGSDSLYGSIPANVQYLGEEMGNMPICKTEPVSQNSVNSMVAVDGSSSSGPGAHGNSELSMYGPPSVSGPYSSRWDDNSASGRFPTALQQPDEKTGKCEPNVKEECKNVGTDRSSFIANRDKITYGEEDQCHEQKNASNSYCKSVGDGPDQRTSCDNQQVSRESYSSNSDSIKCLNDVKTVSSGTSNEQEGTSNTAASSSNVQQNDSVKPTNSPPSSLKNEDKISLNCSNETQTDVQAIPSNNYSSSNVKSDVSGMSDMSSQHNAFKMESGAFKSDSLSQMETVKALENASSHFREKETRDMKEYDLSNEHKDRKPNESMDGGRCESLTVESKDASCGTQSVDLNLNEGKHLVELGAGAMRNIGGKEDPGIPYDWATELLKNYIPGSIENSAKMEVLFCILEESMALGDRILVFSQSLFTLNLIEDFLQRTSLPGRQEKWARNWNYYRLDGSTSALEREKLINEYNSNPNIHLFLVSTRAGSLGINLVGANRVVVFDASWNPCHDTQAVCRVYRYGQKKPCFVYRLVMDNCLEKKIYDRQINKQGMADRVVDECNPDAHLSIKEVTNLCWDNEQDSEPRDFSAEKDKYIDVVMQKLLQRFGTRLSKEPFQHESLLVDRKEKKLSQAEKRLAKRSYELEKQANINYSHRPQYSYYPGTTTAAGNPGMQGTGLQIRAIRTDAAGGVMPKPVASVRPMQAELSQQLERGQTNRSTVTTLNTSGRSRWIPAEVWQRQGMSAQEMTLPLDVVIPTNSPDRASIVLKAGQRVMVLKSPKGIYMQLENGKIIAIRTAFKVGGAGKGSGAQHQECKPASEKAEINAPDYKKESNVTAVNRTANVAKVSSVLPFKNNSAITIIPKNPQPQQRGTGKPMGRIGGNSSGTGIIKQDVTVKPWSPRTGTSVGDVSIPMGGNRNIGSQQPMAQARPYFHRTNTGSSADMATAKPYYHQDSSSDHGMMGHHTSDEGSSGAENMGSTPCGEDRDVMDGGVLKSPSSDDFNQDNSMSSHAFGSIQESNMSNRSSYDGHLGDDMVHDSRSSMSVTYGNHSDQGVQETNMNNSYGRQLGQDIRDSSVTGNRAFRRQMDQGVQGAGNVGHPYVRQTDQRVQETSVSVNHGYGRQMDQSMHDQSNVSHRYGRHVEQTYHDSSAGGNHGFGRQVDQSIQDTGSINRSFGRQTHGGMLYSQQNQAGGYDEHKDTNFNRSDATSDGRYCHAETDSGTNSNLHGPYEDNWQQGQGFRGMSRVSGGAHGHDSNTADGRHYQQPFKGSQHGAEKHSLANNSTREKPHSSFADYSHRQQHQEAESPTFRSEVTDSATSGNDSGVEILPLPTPHFTPASKELLPQQSTNLNAPHGKTTSLKNYRHNSFNAQLHGRDIESSTSSENTIPPIRRNLPEKPLSAEHYIKSPQQTSYSSDIKSPSSFQKSNDELKVSNQNIPVSAFPHAGNMGNLSREDSSNGVMGSPFLGTGNSPVSQRTLHSSKNRQKNAPNIGRFSTAVNSAGNFNTSVIPPTPATKSKRANIRGEQQHFEFESHDATSEASRITPQQQQQLPGKSANRNQIFPTQPQPYHSHASPQQAPSHTPPSSNPANSAATSVSKKGRGNKNASSDRSPSYAGGGTNTDSDSQHHSNGSNSQQLSPQNVPVQTPHSAPVFPPNPQYPAFDGSSNKPLEPYSSPMYGHQPYYPAPGYYGGFGGAQQPPVAFGGNPYYSGESQYGAGRVDSTEPSVNKHIQKGNQSQSGSSPPQQQQQQQQLQQQSTQPMSQSTTPSHTQLPSGIGSQKKDQSNQLGNSAPASDSPTKSVASVTTPSTPTTVRDVASPSSTSGGSRSGNNSARSTPATVSSTSIMQEPNSPQLHFNTPTSASSTTLENRSPVQYNAAMTANPTPLDPKSPLQYSSSTAGGNSSSSTAPPLQYNTSATSSNFAAGMPSTPQSNIIPQTSYEPVMLGGYPAGAGGSGYAPPPPPPPPPPAPPPPPPPPPPGMGYGSYSNPANQYEADYARASMYSAFHRPDPHPHPFAPGHPPGFLPPPQSANYYPQNMYGPTPYGTPDPAYYSNPFLNAMHQHPYPTLPGTAQNPGPHSQ